MDVKKYFKKSGLIPAIVTDAENGEVLMLAYMNEESLQKTLETGYTWFWSRSRQELWNKGATSGHFQKVVEMYSDCDDSADKGHSDRGGLSHRTQKLFFHAHKVRNPLLYLIGTVAYSV